MHAHVPLCRFRHLPNLEITCWHERSCEAASALEKGDGAIGAKVPRMVEGTVGSASSAGAATLGAREARGCRAGAGLRRATGAAAGAGAAARAGIRLSSAAGGAVCSSCAIEGRGAAAGRGAAFRGERFGLEEHQRIRGPCSPTQAVLAAGLMSGPPFKVPGYVPAGCAAAASYLSYARSAA